MTAAATIGEDALWGPAGVLAAAAAAAGIAYAPRPDQRRFGALIARALERDRMEPGGIVLLEGGTGIGKTLGYLLPGCLEIACSGGRMLVSTHTLALMRQVAETDGPLAV